MGVRIDFRVVYRVYYGFEIYKKLHKTTYNNLGRK